ncbi:sulfatase-like hydrolase/transferase [Actinomadura barringtoniae]|uniref:sulfatase-like hydrolase/transferase n=1 Tax=Actinomadura barringtoniae TaxID=1427535 RepID=UPI0027DAD81E|nr:sulfatase-like hydrolase/transferase [Actinomadura barringtoniae]
MTALAGLLVLFILLMPIKYESLKPGSFVRIPAEALLGIGLAVVLPPRPRRVVAILAGIGMGLLLILKFLDMGFYAVLVRPFDPVLDWTFVRDGMEFLSTSAGRVGAFFTIGAIVVAAVLMLALTTLSSLRLSNVMVRHNRAATGAVAVLGTTWIACAAMGAQVVPGVPVASEGAIKLTYKHLQKFRSSLHDEKEFEKAASIDAFRNTPGDRLLTSLRGKDVMLTFIESYGRTATENPQVAATLDDGTRRLKAAGFESRSGFLTSSTAGGGSWLAHSTTLSGLWINNQRRYHTLVSSNRMTLNKAFQRAGWRSLGIVPGVTRSWPESHFFGYDKIYTSHDLGYQGPRFGWATMPDQYTLQTYQNLEAGKPHPPTFTQMILLSSHAPWAPLPKTVGWDQLGDGSIFNGIAATADKRRWVWQSNYRIRSAYMKSVQYSVDSLVSYVEKYGKDNLVLVFLGDHQPVPLVAGQGASRDVPITIVAHDKAVLDRIAGWGWQDGIRPNAQAPVWPMSAFRDHFLSAFSPNSSGPQAGR